MRHSRPLLLGRLHQLFVLSAIWSFWSLAVEPGVNRLARRGWRRGPATALILFGVIIAKRSVSVVAIGTLVGSQIADLLSNSDQYITDTVNTINDTFGTNFDASEIIADFEDPDGPVQEFIKDRQADAVNLSVAALGVLLQLFSVLLFMFYLVADGWKMRRAICSRLTPARQVAVARWTWELAGEKTGGYLVSRALLLLVSAFYHWIVFQSVGTQAPVVRGWVGVVSQFLPVVGTYLAGVLPVVLTFLDSPIKAAIVLIAIGPRTSRSRTTCCRRASSPARWSCTRRWCSARPSAGQPCSARSVPCWPCRPRRWRRRWSPTGDSATPSCATTWSTSAARACR